MKAYLIDTHLLVPRSRSSAKVKVKYQGYVSQKMGVLGAYVSQTHLVNHVADDFILTLYQTMKMETHQNNESINGRRQFK